MKSKVFIFFIILLVLLGSFFAVYLRKKPAPSEYNVPEDLKIGVLGESRSDNVKDSFNKEVLGQLFKVLSEQDVRTIFFSGNLVIGRSKPQQETLDKTLKDKVNYSKDILNDPLGQEGSFYSPADLHDQLKQFNAFVQSSFNYPINFYPTMGNNEAIGPRSSEIFLEEFKIRNAVSSPNGEIRYTVSIGNSFFAVISTNYYDSEQKQIVEHAITQDTLEWLETVLNKAKLNHRFLFVMGHEPAFSTPSIFNKRYGLDNHAEKRDAFWNVLKKYGVLAYFSSHEQVYDRSIRDGVWQIISGGGGSPLNEGEEYYNAFFHSLILIVPQNEKGTPSITVFDKNGNIRDHFKLTQERQPLHQFRISKLS